MVREADVLVIGGGAVGLAITVALSQRGFFVTLLERHPRLASENSSRNSGVIHSGLYYPEGSLKAQLCVRGRTLLYERCRLHGIAHRKLGKLIVARTDAEVATLEMLAARAAANGAGQVELLDAVGLSIEEAHVRGRGALLVHETGILRTHEFTRSLIREADTLRAETFVGMEVVALERVGDRWDAEVRAHGSEGRIRFRAPFVVNAAGLGAVEVARLAGVDVRALGYTPRLCRGTWFSLPERYRKAIGRLVYPVPVYPHGKAPESPHPDAGVSVLGVHLTRDLEGFLHAGPDAEWLPADVTAQDPALFSLEAALLRRPDVHRALLDFLPDVHEEELMPLMCGVRPKLHGPEEPASDFVLSEGTPWGAPGMVLLLGIESPGLTAALAIAERVGALLTR